MSQSRLLKDADTISSLSLYRSWLYCNIDCLHNKVTNAPKTVNWNFSSFTGTSAEEPSVSPSLIFYPSFGLSVVSGTLSKAGCRGWAWVRDTVKRLLNYSFLSEKSRTRKDEQKMLAIGGKKICSTSDCSRRQLLKHYPWSSFALCVSVSKFFVSFCLIRNLTMFSLVKMLKQ